MILVIVSILVGYKLVSASGATVGQQLLAPESGWQRINDSDSRIIYDDSWRVYTENSKWYGGEATCKNDKAAIGTIKFKFYGTQLRIIGWHFFNYSNNISIYIDDVQYTFSEYDGTRTTTALFQTLDFEKTGLSNSVHSVLIKTNDTEGALIDAIDIDSSGYLITPVTGISLNKQQDSILIGSTDTLSAIITPSDATDKNVTWTSSDSNIATVDNTGKITGIKAGTAIIEATTEDGGLTATCTVTVLQPVTGITLNKTTDTLNVGQSDQLISTIHPADASNQSITWTSSDPNIATVDSTGNVTALSVGTATITVTTADGNKTATCVLTVTNQTRAILIITMSNGERQEYDLSIDEIAKFVDWYNGNTSPSYAINKDYNVEPFDSRIEYIAHDKVSSFEVNQYSNTTK